MSEETGEVLYKASRDQPETLRVLIEGLEYNRALVERGTAVVLGVGEMFEDIQVKQMLDMMQVSIAKIDQSIDVVNAVLDHTNKMFAEIKSEKSRIKQEIDELEATKQLLENDISNKQLFMDKDVTALKKYGMKILGGLAIIVTYFATKIAGNV